MMPKAARKFIVFLIMILSSGFAIAQQETLIDSVGIYTFTFRQFAEQDQRYNSAGKLEPLGTPFNKSFNGKNLIKGVGGEELQKLADQLKRFDGVTAPADGLLNSLKLGKLHADIKGKVDAKIFSTAFGVTDHLTLYLGVPWVSASVDTKLNFSGDNNISEIRGRVGELAFEELKSGFNRAETITTAQIKENIYSKGYANLDHWQYNGLGDIVVGQNFGNLIRFNKTLKGYQLLNTSLSIPTGYYDDPDVLTDVSVGKGYYQLNNRYAQRFLVLNRIWAGAEFTYGYGLPTTVEKRLPETDESLPSANRKTSVTFTPGADFDYGLLAGYNSRTWYMKLEYKLAIKRHMGDKYSGSRAGNYGKLSEATDSYQFYHEPVFKLDSTKRYQNGQARLPYIFQLRAHLPITARNSSDERFYEAAISSFFATK
jgi:hypothetical protein